MQSDEERSGSVQWVGGEVLEDVVSVPPLDRMARMEGLGDFRGGPREDLPSAVVERTDDGLGIAEAGREGDDVPDRAHPAIRPARASEEGLPRIPEDLGSFERRKALSFDRPLDGLPLMAVERPAVVGDLEGDPHANRHNDS